MMEKAKMTEERQRRTMRKMMKMKMRKAKRGKVDADAAARGNSGASDGASARCIARRSGMRGRPARARPTATSASLGSAGSRPTSSTRATLCCLSGRCPAAICASCRMVPMP